jgi:hypothetical protein
MVVVGVGEGERNPAQPASGRIDKAHSDRNQQERKELMAHHSKIEDKRSHDRDLDEGCHKVVG